MISLPYPIYRVDGPDILCGSIVVDDSTSDEFVTSGISTRLGLCLHGLTGVVNTMSFDEESEEW